MNGERIAVYCENSGRVIVVLNRFTGNDYDAYTLSSLMLVETNYSCREAFNFVFFFSDNQSKRNEVLNISLSLQAGNNSQQQ